MTTDAENYQEHALGMRRLNGCQGLFYDHRRLIFSQTTKFCDPQSGKRFPLSIDNVNVLHDHMLKCKFCDLSKRLLMALSTL